MNEELPWEVESDPSCEARAVTSVPLLGCCVPYANLLEVYFANVWFLTSLKVTMGFVVEFLTPPEDHGCHLYFQMGLRI